MILLFVQLLAMKAVTNGSVCNIYNMSGHPVSVYTDTSALREYVCTLIQNAHEYCKLLIK